MPIKYVVYNQLDQLKWDACIENSANGLIYGYSIYLNAMANQWDALVLNDYEVVMPLPYYKKYGICYLYQPFFTIHLGVFGNALSPTLINNFLQAIPFKFRFWDIHFNKTNRFILTDFALYERINMVLSLNDNYDNLYQHFRENVKRNIKKTIQLNGVVKRDIPITAIISLSREHALKSSRITGEDYDHFAKLYHQLYGNKKAVTYGVYTTKNELLASAVFLFSHASAYCILVGNHPNAKTLGAFHSLINEFIKDHAGQNLLLNFEETSGSQLAFFYSSFGATEEKYCGLKLNRLPFWAKWLQPYPAFRLK